MDDTVMNNLIALRRDFEISYTHDTADNTPWEVIVWNLDNIESKILAMGNGSTFEAALAEAMLQIHSADKG